MAVFVIRHPSPANVVALLESFGLEFVEEKHGNGPVHWAAEADNGSVLEVYPARKDSDNSASFHDG